jgi:predicted nucleic acid-binding protein
MDRSRRASIWSATVECARKALAAIADFQSATVLLLPDEQTVEVYSTVKAELATAGTQIPENDIWIAAAALQYGLPIATRDKHFTVVSGLKTLVWWFPLLKQRKIDGFGHCFVAGIAGMATNDL